MSEQVFGCLKSPKDIRDFKVCLQSTSIETLPESFQLAKSHIKDQGKVNSCVAHALSSMMEINDRNNYSTEWIYGYRPEGYYQGEGMYPREALKTLANKGAILNTILPQNVEIPEAKAIVDSKLSEYEVLAKGREILAYAKLNNEAEIKNWLFTKNTAVPISIATTKIELDANNIILIPDKYPDSGHMMLIIGWNKFGFIVQNSWRKSLGK